MSFSFGSDPRNLNGGRENVLLVLATAHHDQLRQMMHHQHQHHSLRYRPGSKNARRFSQAICALRQLGETLSERVAELRWRQLGTSFDSPHTAYQEMKQWAYEEHREEPLEIPSLRSLRHTDA